MTEPARTPALIAVDWGTTRFRAFLLDAEGRVLDTRASEDGIAALRGRGHAEVFARECGAWRARHPGLPTLLAGMVGSRNGWVEVPYVSLPAGLAGIAAGLARIDVPGGGQGAIVSGLVFEEESRSDVMRGEETKILGAAGAGAEVLCLPGTHCKWARVENGRVTRFRTFVTGELFGVLRQHSFLASLDAPGEDPKAFAQGLAAAKAAEGLLGALFMGRTGVLDGRLSAEGVGNFLSGLLIGAEIKAARGLFRAKRVKLVATGDLAREYARAFDQARLPFDLMDAGEAFLSGLMRIARAARLIEGGQA